MSSIIYGKKGAGKSYFSIKHYLLPALEKGYNVFTNLDFGYNRGGLEFIPAYKFSDYLKKDCRPLLHTFRKHSDLLDKIKMDFQDDIEGESLRVPHHSTIIVDEAHDIFYYMDANRMDKRVYNFLAYARHFDINLVFMSQAPGLMSKFVEELATDVYVLTNLSRFGGGRNSIMVKTYQSSRLVNVHEGHDSKTFERYDRTIFPLYRSSLAPESQNMKRLPFFMWVPVAMVVIAVIVFALAKGKTFLF